ncbi:MAG: 6-phospho-beta-glucosidase [Bifidobacteriaceae bacterium]|jgi:6-phospho-beta-glucosidase|nr:6-phospho-beta-glucosidase [Bifidobacteriaceae bacterium]
MKLTVLGGGGFRVPQVYQALASRGAPVRIDELALYDTSRERLNVIDAVVASMRPTGDAAPRVSATTNLDEAVRGADFVFCAIRVGGTAGRTLDERVALDLGVLGQETVGPGGLAYTLRTVPVMVAIARRVAALAPEAWFVNFTNPAGAVTEALTPVLGERVVGICDTPIGLVKRAARALGMEAAPSSIDYVGLNHLGWLRGIADDDGPQLPRLLADDAALEGIEEARLMGLDWVRTLGALPNEYLYYYYYTREAVARIRAGSATRGEFLAAQQSQFYLAASEDRAAAGEMWTQVRATREATYMAEARPEGEEGERDPQDLGGGYQQVALELMAALAGGPRAHLILNVRGGGLVAGLPEDAVVEVPCRVDGSGMHALPVAPVGGHMLALMQSVKASEQLMIEAALTGSRATAWKAFAVHPLVDSVAVARELCEGYGRAHPELAWLAR